MHSHLKQPKNPSYTEYSEFWNSTLSKIDSLQISVRKSADALESEYIEFNELITHLKHDIEILMSVYSGFNTIHGNELLKKLHSMIVNYHRKHITEGINFDLIYSILDKIQKQREKDFENFPVLDHDQKSIIHYPEQKTIENEVKLSTRPYKWITFRRNRSWFILPFRTCTTHTTSGFSIIHSEKPDTLWIDLDEETVKTIDFFTDYNREYIKPEFIIEINHGEKFYAADSVGRRIYSRSDIISPLLKGYRNEHRKSPGRARLFGRNHIVLR